MKKAFLISMLLLSAASVFADEAERMRFADGLYARGMYQLAVNEYEGILKEFAGSHKEDVMLFRLAESLRHLEKTQEADKYFRDLYIKHPKSEYRHRAGFRRADLHRRSGSVDNAVTLYTLLLENGAAGEIKAASLFYLGELRQEQGKMDLALKAFEEVKNAHAKSDFYAYAMLKLGEMYSSMKSYDKSVAAYKAVANDPVSRRMGAEALFQLAELHYSRKDYTRSSDAYRQLLQKYPDDKRSSEAKVQAAWSQHNARRYADALKLADEGAKAGGPQAAEWIYLKANCLRQLLKNSEAAEAYAELLKEYPDSDFAASARYEKALSSYRAGNYEAAIADGEKIPLSPSDDPDAENLRKDIYWLLAESYAALKKDDDAVQYYRMISVDFPKSEVAGDAVYRLAYHLQSREDYGEASRQYRVVAANFPKHKLAPKALFASGICQLRSGSHEEAVRDWAGLIAAYSKDPLAEEAMYRKAVSEVRMKRNETAVETLAAMLKKYPQSRFSSEAHYWRGALLRDAGKLEDAENEYRQSLKGKLEGELKRDAEFHLAVVLHKRGRKDESAGMFSSLLKTSAAERFTPELLEWVSGYWYLEKDHPRARAAAEVLQNRFKQDDEQQTALAMIGRTYFAEGNMEKAEKYYIEALSIDVVTEYCAEAALRLGEVMLKAKRYQDAEKSFRKAADTAAGDDGAAVRAHAYAGLARVAAAADELDDAARYYMSVAILYDEEQLVSECLYEAALAFRKLERGDEETKAAAELAQRYPQSRYLGKLKENR